MRFAPNPFRKPRPVIAPSGAREFHRTLPGYAPTPLIDCEALADSFGLKSLQVKDESQRFGLNAFKALGAAWAMNGAMQGMARPGIIFSAATAGNHGRGALAVGSNLRSRHDYL